MNYEKALSLYKHDKTLQLLRAEHFPLLVGFFHQAFKEQNNIAYLQSELQGLLGDYLFLLERNGIPDYKQTPQDYLSRWAEKGYLRRYYESADEPVYELSPSTENALKWLEDLNKQEFIGTHSRLLQFFHLLKQIVSGTAGPEARIRELETERQKIEEEIQQIRGGDYAKTSDTQIKENYYLAEEIAKRLLSDFRQVEENFRQLDVQTRQTIVKSSLGKADLLDNVFEQQDHLWNTDQGKSFRSFWEFLMSEQMQQELEDLLQKINALPEIRDVKQEQTVDKIKINLVEAGDKVNRSNDGLVEQLRKFVEQKNLQESRHILHNIEQIEELLLEDKEAIAARSHLMEIDGLYKPSFIMGRPLFSPPVSVFFSPADILDGLSEADTRLLFEQFYVDLEQLKEHIHRSLSTRTQISLTELIKIYPPKKGAAEILGYMQIASNHKKHLILREQEVELNLENTEQGLQVHPNSSEPYVLVAPVILFNR